MMIQKATSSPARNPSETAIVSVDSFASDFNLMTTTPPRSSPLGAFWDMENCPVPSDVRPEDVSTNIRTAIHLHPVLSASSVVVFSAFGDFNAFPRRVREGCQRTGVKLVDVPNGRKDASDKAILLDMFLFALDHPPPSTIVIITGDVDFAPALHVLGQRGYNVVVVIPSGVYVNPALISAGRFVWDWQSVARGEGFVPLPNPRTYLIGNNEDETILYRGNNSREAAASSSLIQFQNECSSSSSMCYPPPPPPPGHLESTMFVAPGDFNGLKGQLVKLLEISGGCMPLMRVPSEYQRNFSKPLFVADYGSPKLVDLFKKMGDVIAVDGKGNKRFVYLRSSRPSRVVSPSPPSPPPVILLRRENKGKDITVVTTNGGGVSSDELSDSGSAQSEMSLEEFKFELQDIMVSYGCRVRMDCFEAVYKQRYKRSLDYVKMGVGELEQLFDKFSDVVAVYEDPATGTKLINAI